LYDALEKQLENYFAEYGINARFEGIFAKGGGVGHENKTKFRNSSGRRYTLEGTKKYKGYEFKLFKESLSNLNKKGIETLYYAIEPDEATGYNHMKPYYAFESLATALKVLLWCKNKKGEQKIKGTDIRKAIDNVKPDIYSSDYEEIRLDDKKDSKEKTDAEKIEEFVSNNYGFENEAKINRLIKTYTKEWNAVKDKYKSIDQYIKQIEDRGDFYAKGGGVGNLLEKEKENLQEQLNDAIEKGRYSTMSAIEESLNRVDYLIEYEKETGKKVSAKEIKKLLNPYNKFDEKYSLKHGGTLKEQPKKVSFEEYAKHIGIKDDLIKSVYDIYMDRSKSSHTQKLQISKAVGSENQRKLFKWFEYDGYLPSNIYKKGGITKAQSKKVGKVMHEWKAGKLHSGSKKGPIVKDQKQAVAIALSEAGLSKKETGGELTGWKHKRKK
jgi:hypothetical protein